MSLSIPKKILFDHIPKTGGSALHAVFIKWYGSDQTSPQLKGLWLRDALLKYHNINVISGHLRFQPGDMLPQNRLKISIVRDPIDRALSSYFFNRNHVSGTYARDVELAKTFEIDKFFFLDDPIVDSGFSNVQVRHFASLCETYDTQGESLSDELLLTLARKALEQFDIVGSYSDFEDFVSVVGIEAEVPQWENIPKVNVTSGRVRPSDIEQGVIERIKQLNALDIMLVEEIGKIFSSHRTQVLKQCVGSRYVVASPNAAQIEKAEKEEIHSTEKKVNARDFGSREIEILSISVVGALTLGSDVLTGEEISISVIMEAHQPAADLTIGLHISDPCGVRVFGINSRLLGMVLSITSPGQMLVHFKMKCELGRGEYRVGASAHKGHTHLEKCYHWRDDCSSFNVVGMLGVYFEGMFRLYPSISVAGGDNHPSTFELIETGITYPQSIMLQSPRLTEFHARIQIEDFQYQPNTGEILNMVCRITNDGSEAWPIAGTRPVCISYHWLDQNRHMVIFDGLRTRLPSIFKPDHCESFPIQIQAPYQAGSYVLQITALQENVGWFDENGCAAAEIIVTVEN
jgi:hypothetical protein